MGGRGASSGIKTLLLNTNDNKVKKQIDGSKTEKVGTLDISILQKGFPDVRNGEVVLTPPQFKHIQKDHPDALPILLEHGKEIMSDPDLVIKDLSEPNTVLVIKTLNKSYKAVIRLAVSSDEEWKKNSIISFHRMKPKGIENKKKHNVILYEKRKK